MAADFINPQEAKKPAVTGFLVGGEEGTRTLDLFDANEALSQLSYSPRRAEYTSGPEHRSS